MLTSAFPLSANRPGNVCLQGHLAISFSLMPLRVTWSCFYAVMFQSCGWLSGVACIPKVFWSGLLLLLFIYFLRKVHREKCSGCWGKERINSRALSPLHSFSILSEICSETFHWNCLPPLPLHTAVWQGRATWLPWKNSWLFWLGLGPASSSSFSQNGQ